MHTPVDLYGIVSALIRFYDLNNTCVYCRLETTGEAVQKKAVLDWAVDHRKISELVPIFLLLEVHLSQLLSS